MKANQIDGEELSKVLNRLGEAAVNPEAWRAVMDDICKAVGASAALLLQSDIRTPDVPRTESIAEATDFYFRNNWQLRDPRAKGFPRMMAGEVVTDLDVMTPEQIRADPMYNEVLFPFGYRWFAGIGFWADSAAWALTIQRTGREGAFEARDKQLLAQLAPRLTETATLATAIGRAALTSMTDVLDRVRQPALVLNRDGMVLRTNAVADRGFDDEIRIRDRRLVLRDKQAMTKLDQLISMIRSTPDAAAIPASPILIRRTTKPPVVLRTLPVDGAARSVFLGARAMLILSNLVPRVAPDPVLIGQAFDLTPAESRLTALLATGASLASAAEHLRISRETARNHLKSIFSKTGAHRQSELVTLVSQLG
ncbi:MULTISPECIES: helix-turn-helix transcriptional regulator [unclassified Bradyrhizobium]|uniref:helix-turn-helix transcriptional regulator n=1 Tax=unclassified Bradyrhizobium TaxID=2631580 RepID=UPI001FF62B15|nr:MULTISPECIES: helix-turn-helix transcriptional regulator [unclassified Bradyrhizobium]MCJ9699926.1 helix-turn-helix transcriptional regulator [Bradyrhizobium sp. SHOUNA76]MCJ9729835.1 helix-turn-helix transcriptional regulator [Bradyrhizobium sp. PRIMUS42]